MRLLLPLGLCLAISACSEAERDAAADADGNGSMTAATAGATDDVGPSTIDCARARGQAEQAVCADKELTAIDRGLSEMPGYAVDAAWVAKRGECSHSDDLRHCLLDLYASRVADLAASGMKEGGIVWGPVDLRCGPDEAVAYFLRSDPGVMHLKIGDQRVTLPHAAPGSNTEYKGMIDGRPWSFWSKNRQVTLVRAGGEEIACKELGRIDE